MTRGYFVTGTDTGVGKTFVTIHLARLASSRGHKVFAFKPLETGCHPPLGDDQRLLVASSGGWQTDDLAGVYQFALPAAPLVAAQAEQTMIDLARIDRAFHSGASVSTLTLVEGAGGWRVPITNDVDMGGLAKHLALPVVLVARATLGTLNHTLLTAQAIERDDCQLAAVILSCKPNDDLSLVDSNLEQLQRFLPRVFLLQNDPQILDALF